MARTAGGFAPRDALILGGDWQTFQQLQTAQLLGEPMRAFGNKWGSAVEREAMRTAPRFEGEYRRSLTHEVDPAPMPAYARAGTKLLILGRVIEHGTGLLADVSGGTGKRHWPPAKYLDHWAAKKQIRDRDNPERVLTGEDIAAIIGLRGGLRPHRTLRNAAEKADARIPGWLRAFARDVEERRVANVGQH